MSTPGKGMVVRISGNIDDLKRALEEGTLVIQRTMSQAEKLAASFKGDKLVANAMASVEAINKVGASTLTAAENAKQLKVLDQAMEKLRLTSQPIPPLLQETAAKLRELSPPAEGFLSKLGPIGPAIAGAFSVGAIKAFVSSMVSAAEEVQKMADRTGDTKGHIQELQYIAGQTETSFDGLINAAQNLQQRLGDGDAGAAGAMKRLGVNAAELSTMGATEALYTINEALGSVHSQTERASLMADLFGKSWKDIAPAMTADMRALADDAPKVRDATNDALVKAGDRWEWLTGKIKVAGAEVLNFAFDTARLATAADFWEKLERPVVRNESAVRKVAAAMLDASGNVKKFGVTEEEAERIAKELDAALKAKSDTAKRAAAAARDLANANVEVFKATKLLPPTFTTINGMLVQVDAAAKNAAGNFQFLGWHTDALQSSGLKLGNTTIPVVTSGMIATGKAAEQAGNAIRDKLAAVITNLPQTFRSAFEGGGGVIGALKSIGTQMADALAGSFFEKLATAFKTGSGFGAAFSSLLNPATIAIPGIIAGLNSMIAHQEKIRAISAENARLMEEGAAEYAKRLEEVGKEYDDLLATLEDVQLIRVTELSDMEAQLPILREMASLQDKIHDTEQEIADLQDKLVPSWQDVEAAVRKYGLSIDGAGQKVQQLKIRQNALDFINDWEMLQRAGWDTAGMLDGMQDELNAMVKEAMKYGVELPANMKPVLEKLADQGGLVDANGKKLKDLTGIKFGAPVETEADKINKAIKALVDKLAEFIAKFDALTEKSKDAATKVEDDWKTAPWEKWTEPRFPRMDTGDDGGDTGDNGRVPRTPRDRTTMLVGGSSALSSASRASSSASSSVSQTIVVQLDGQVIARAAARNLPRQLILAGR